MAYKEKEKEKVEIEISIVYRWSIGAFFYGNFMVTVLSSVEHGCSDWSMWLEKKLLPPVRPISA